MEILNPKYWDQLYQNEETGWDIGYANPEIVNYFKTVENKDSRILIPGCGNGYEGEALYNMGFRNLTLLDYAPLSKTNFLERVEGFRQEQFEIGNFFDHKGEYDYIVEQTFFCALNPDLRSRYVEHVHQLLERQARLVGLMFNIPLFDDHPPFGGSEVEYRNLFSPLFSIASMHMPINSVPARRENELFIELVKK